MKYPRWGSYNRISTQGKFGTSRTMASGVTLQESEKQKPDGFFPKLYENICKTMSEKDLDTMPDEKADNDQFIR